MTTVAEKIAHVITCNFALGVSYWAKAWEKDGVARVYVRHNTKYVGFITVSEDGSLDFSRAKLHPWDLMEVDGTIRAEFLIRRDLNRSRFR